MMGHFPAPWGNELSVGPLEAVLAVAICLVMLMAVWETEWAAAAWVKLRHSARVMKYSIFLLSIGASFGMADRTRDFIS